MDHTAASTGLRFMKMHGLGNDFVVIDARDRAVALPPALVSALADRHMGVGFDQLALIHTGDGAADARLTFLNADGSASATCGNATRCIAQHLMAETGARELKLETERGLLTALATPDGPSVNMGAPLTDWQDIPLASAMDTLVLPIDGSPTATGLGNPHCTFFVEDAEAVDIERLGPATEHHPLFPQRTNVQFATVLAPDRIRMRVWERGAGLTLASGSSSCAVAVAAARRGLTGRSVTMILDGGSLRIDWREDGVWMTGPTAHVFTGTLTPGFLAGLG